MPAGWRVADVLTWLRLLLLPVIWWQALLGHGQLVGLGLVLAGTTDFLDGFLARRLGQESPEGARLDSIADILLLVSAMVCIELLHPEIAHENPAVVAGAFSVYFASLAVGLIKFRRLGNLHLYSAKVAGGFLYAFAVLTLVTGGYDRLLLVLAAAALTISSLETLAAHLLFSAVDESMGSVLLARTTRADTNTIQARGSARKHRSQAPTANAVGSRASPTSSTATIATPRPKESGP
jgi:phosphatidylglycerophosphate synthase